MLDNIYIKYDDMKFCKIHSKMKNPYEKDWVNKPHKMSSVGKNNDNVGVLTGYSDYLIIDIDDVVIIDKLRELLNCNTLIVKSGSGNGYHLYYKISDPDNITKNKYILHNNNKHVGEILWFGCQGVAAGSIHPNGNTYNVINKADILNITADKILHVAEVYAKSVTDTVTDSCNSLQVRTSNILKSIVTSSKIMHEISLRDSIQKNNVLFKNLAIFCHYNKQYETVCYDFVSMCGCTSAEFKGWINKAPTMSINEIELKNWIDEFDLSAIFGNVDNYTGLEVIDESEVLEWKDNEQHIIKNLIYCNTVNMLYAPPASFKSFLSLYMSMCLASGEDFVDMPVKQCNVLYLDKENPKVSYKNRYRGLLAGTGMGTHRKLFTYKSGDILNAQFLLNLQATIKKYKIKVVVFDTLHRFGNYNEDKADDLNQVYTECFQPLTEKFDCTVIFLHHTTKGEKQNYRGSSDLEGMCDCIIKFCRVKKTNVVKMKVEKNRHGKEIEDQCFMLNIESDENDKIETANFEQFTDPTNVKIYEIVQSKIISLLKDESMSRKDLIDKIRNIKSDFSVSWFDKMIAKMKDDNIITLEDKLYKLNSSYKVKLL